MSEVEPLVMAFEYDGLHWNRMSERPSVFPPTRSYHYPIVVLDDGKKTWCWWAGGSTGENGDLYVAQATALEALRNRERYEVHLVVSPSNRDVFRAGVTIKQRGMVQRRVFYGESTFNYLGPKDAARHTRWYAERTDQPGPTPGELSALHEAMTALLKRRETTCALAEHFAPFSVTVTYP